MINIKTYLIALTIITIVCTYFLPWWTIPILITILSYFTNDISAIKASAIAIAITTLVWIVIAGIQEFSAINKVSTMTGQILGKSSPSLVYVATGLSISLVSGLAAALGRNVAELLVKRY